MTGTKKELKIVSLKWIDIAESSSNWRTLEELEEFITDTKSKICHQVGLLFEEDENQIVLLNSYFPDDDLYGTATILPKGCIIERKDYGKL